AVHWCAGRTDIALPTAAFRAHRAVAQTEEANSARAAASSTTGPFSAVKGHRAIAVGPAGVCVGEAEAPLTTDTLPRVVTRAAHRVGARGGRRALQAGVAISVVALVAVHAAVGVARAVEHADALVAVLRVLQSAVRARGTVAVGDTDLGAVALSPALALGDAEPVDAAATVCNAVAGVTDATHACRGWGAFGGSVLIDVVAAVAVGAPLVVHGAVLHAQPGVGLWVDETPVAAARTGVGHAALFGAVAILEVVVGNAPAICATGAVAEEGAAVAH